MVRYERAAKRRDVRVALSVSAGAFVTGRTMRQQFQNSSPRVDFGWLMVSLKWTRLGTAGRTTYLGRVACSRRRSVK